ncbi:MAG: 4-hydroxyphenylpyruvate dioxygenase [Oligoflexales bacterium]|nr:4-hydroxyphenylpyruvate dioxygenase [Oligoflexales bacterium]
MKIHNPVGLEGIEFIEFSSEQASLEKMFQEFGFSMRLERVGEVKLYEQGQIHFLINQHPRSFAANFSKAHGPCVSSMGWRVKDAQLAFKEAVDRGAKPAPEGDYKIEGKKIPAVYGIGDSLIYFIDAYKDKSLYERMGFTLSKHPIRVENKGFELIDHLTNNVYKGTMDTWAKFYKDIFGFTEIRYFDIRGIKTGLTSFALKSPCGSFCIPINEGTEKKSQINEYLDEYKGPGVQHIALLTHDIVKSIHHLDGSSIQMLDIDDEYYDSVFDRVPHVSEDHKELQRLKILVDGDEDGYLLQIFTRNLIGPIFIELIQRKNHHAFGEGNFGALFRAIERDQERRGYL